VFANNAISVHVFNTLFVRDVTRDKNWVALPQGVEYLPTPANGTWRLDGNEMTLLWKLKRRTWHDGRLVTCADYVFTFNMVSRAVRPGGFIQKLLNRVVNVSCPQGAGGLDVLVAWKQQYAYANLSIIPWPSAMRWPRHVLQPLLDPTAPVKLRDTPYGHEPAATIGDGAYRLVEWRTGRSLTVESVGSHPIYGTPKIKRITWRFILDRSALFAALLSGDIDASSTIGITHDQARQLERQAAGRIKALYEPASTWEHIDFNLGNPLLQDIRIRRAIAHGINRTQIVQQLFQGKQPISHSYLPTQHPGYTENVQRYPYDPARTRALLREAGFAPGPDGIMQNAAGQRLSLELSTTEGVLVREQVEQIIQQQLRQVGIEITILNFPFRVFVGQIMERRKFKAMGMYSWVLDPTDDCDGLYSSDGIPSEQNNWAGGNFPGYKDAAMDQVCKAISREIDEGKRNKLLNESARIFSRDLPALPLYFRVTIAAAKVGLQNFSPSGLSELSDTWNVHQWFWESK
jgi:peptide/nickel transport system substrate-binding protein